MAQFSFAATPDLQKLLKDVCGAGFCIGLQCSSLKEDAKHLL